MTSSFRYSSTETKIDDLGDYKTKRDKKTCHKTQGQTKSYTKLRSAL
jgi:hypothetical protein